MAAATYDLTEAPTNKRDERATHWRALVGAYDSLDNGPDRDGLAELALWYAQATAEDRLLMRSMWRRLG